MALFQSAPPGRGAEWILSSAARTATTTQLLNCLLCIFRSPAFVGFIEYYTKWAATGKQSSETNVSRQYVV